MLQQASGGLAPHSVSGGSSYITTGAPTGSSITGGGGGSTSKDSSISAMSPPAINGVLQYQQPAPASMSHQAQGLWTPQGTVYPVHNQGGAMAGLVQPRVQYGHPAPAPPTPANPAAYGSYTQSATTVNIGPIISFFCNHFWKLFVLGNFRKF